MRQVARAVIAQDEQDVLFGQVGDDVVARIAAELEDVGPLATGQGVVAGAAVYPVVAEADPLPPVQGVKFLWTLPVAGLLAAAVDDVVAGTAVDRVVAVEPSAYRGDIVVAGPQIDDDVAETAVHPVVATACIDRIVAVAAIKRVRARRRPPARRRPYIRAGCRRRGRHTSCRRRRRRAACPPRHRRASCRCRRRRAGHRPRPPDQRVVPAGEELCDDEGVVVRAVAQPSVGAAQAVVAIAAEDDVVAEAARKPVIAVLPIKVPWAPRLRQPRLPVAVSLYPRL